MRLVDARSDAGTGDRGRIAILICSDIEFPEVARVADAKGANIFFVPFDTGERYGSPRIRRCAQARGIENQEYIAGCAGNLPGVPQRRHPLRPARGLRALGLPVRARRHRRREHPRRRDRGDPGRGPRPSAPRPCGRRRPHLERPALRPVLGPVQGRARRHRDPRRPAMK
ncbi:MAG: hypothetical protein FJ255_13080, partial [Phycisphaerae bacterium]|nr:hypothetical protein [Phycisphaerae bacterium]